MVIRCLTFLETTKMLYEVLWFGCDIPNRLSDESFAIAVVM
jgi:hypothetical protein